MPRISRILLQISQLPSSIVTRMAEPVVQKSSNPFANLKISSWEPLKSVDGRGQCPTCHRSRKLYCYTCYCLVGLKDPSIVPVVNLPISVDILKHPKELDGKSTAVHARILAPHQVTMHIYPDIPTYTDTSRLLLLYPKKEALCTHEAAEMIKESSWVSGASSDQSGATRVFGPSSDQSGATRVFGASSDQSGATIPPNPWGSFDRLVVIDSTWNGTNKILNDERVKHLPSVKLTEAETTFWRPQRKHCNKHLATIEAIYYFFKEMSELVEGHAYDGLYDNLLFFYAYQYSLVKQAQHERFSRT